MITIATAPKPEQHIASRTSTQSEAQRLPVRRLRVDLSAGFARHWHGGDAFRTQFFNALSMAFPVGEQYFIDSVKEALALLPQDPQYAVLRSEIRGFAAQEATHRFVHAAYNQVLDLQGLRNHWQCWSRRRIGWTTRMHPLNKLAITCAFEHLTAILADGSLRYDAWLASATPDMQAVWRWHASEETEHRAVAFNLYRALGGGTVRRVGWFVYTALVFGAEATAQTMINLWRDATLLRPRTWLSALRFMLGRSGVLRLSARPLLAYLHPQFHPDASHHTPLSEVLAHDWLAQNADRFTLVGPAAQG